MDFNETHEKYDNSNKLERLDNCSKEDFQALRCLVESENILNTALLFDAVDLYREAFYLAERVVLHYPESTILKSAVVYFILGLTRLKGWDDRTFAIEKYQAILESDLEVDQKLAQILKREIDRE